MKRMLIFAAALFIFTMYAHAQDGGKAEPKRINFPSGASETVLRGYLKNGQEMEYVFAAQNGQKIALRNSGNSMFDVRVFSEEFGVETEFDSSREFSIVAPATGDYLLFVRKKMVRSPAKARFNVLIRIR